MRNKKLTKKEIRRKLQGANLNAGAVRVLWYMSDGKWHDRIEIEKAANRNRSRRALEGMRRMRELREYFNLQKKQAAPFQYDYRLVS